VSEWEKVTIKDPSTLLTIVKTRFRMHDPNFYTFIHIQQP
jgi:hypothetical protein